MRNHDDIKRQLTAAGLPSVAAHIATLARPCYRIERTSAAEEQIPVGSSKFGGLPDVSAGFVWPVGLEFIAQVRLSDLPDPVPVPVPLTGLLSFFHDWEKGRVFYHPEETVLQRVTATPPAPPAAAPGLLKRLFGRNPEPPRTYRSCLLKAVQDLSLPDGGSSLMQNFNLPEADLEAYFELPSSGTTNHQMFGYSSPVQNEMELECDAMRRSQPMRWDAPRERFIAAMEEWILLLQVDTDDYEDGPGWMWGDAGILYFWIHRDDLAARAFDRVIAIEQCH